MYSPTFSHTCPGASAPRCLRPAPPPPHLLLPAGQKAGQAEHPHLCRRSRCALPAPPAARRFIGPAAARPSLPCREPRPLGCPRARAGPPPAPGQPLAARDRFPSSGPAPTSSGTPTRLKHLARSPAHFPS